MTSLADVVADTCARRGDVVALLCGDDQLSFRDIAARTRATAAALVARRRAARRPRRGRPAELRRAGHYRARCHSGRWGARPVESGRHGRGGCLRRRRRGGTVGHRRGRSRGRAGGGAGPHAGLYHRRPPRGPARGPMRCPGSTTPPPLSSCTPRAPPAAQRVRCSRTAPCSPISPRWRGRGIGPSVTVCSSPCPAFTCTVWGSAF